MFQYILPTKGQAQRTDCKTIRHGVDNLWLLSCMQLPRTSRILLHWGMLWAWKQGCAVIGLLGNPNPSPVRRQKPAEAPEAKFAMLPWNPDAYSAQPQPKTQKWDTRGTHCCCKSQSVSESPPQLCRLCIMGLWTPSFAQICVCSLQGWES